jgi:hypothetical protein
LFGVYGSFPSSLPDRNFIKRFFNKVFQCGQ